MTGTAPYDPFWQGESMFEGGTSRPAAPFSFVPAGLGGASDVGRPPGALRARAMLGLNGVAPLAAPLALDVSWAPDASPKLHLALARACGSLGAALCLNPAQLAARAEVIKAAKVPVILSVAPGETASSSLCAKADLLLLRLHGDGGAPALLGESALPPYVEAARAMGGYRVPICVGTSGAAVPEAPMLKEAVQAGLSGLAISAGAQPLALPIAALLGAAARAKAAAPKLPLILDAAGPAEGASIAAALAGGGALALSRAPVQATAAHEAFEAADWKALGDALARALRVSWEDAQRCAARAGLRDPRDLTRENLRALTYDAAALSGIKLAGYDERLPWWAH